MGVGQIQIKDTGVYLYTHSNSDNLATTLQRTMKKKLRWRDPSYLARMIFCRMVEDDLYEEIGYGIDGQLNPDTTKLLIVDCLNQTVTIISLIYNPTPNKNMVDVGAMRHFTFEEFIKVREV